MPVNEATEAPPLKKFRANKILSEVLRAAGDSTESEPVKAVRERLAVALNLSQNALGRMLNNTSQPSLEEASIIAQVLGTTVDALCSYEDQ